MGASKPADRSSEQGYRSILRGTSAFGGVQMLNILAGLVRGKLVAVFLGTVGMGIVSLYNSALNTILRFASLGLNLSVVKEIAAAKSDSERLARVAGTARAMLYATAVLGALVCLVLSPWLSRLTFGDSAHTGGFAMLSLMAFFLIAGAGEMSVLQGLRDTRRLARATAVGSFAGLFVSVPLYWIFGQRGIVPSMIILTGMVYAFNCVSARRSLGAASFIAWRRLDTSVARTLVATGAVLMASDAVGTAFQYVLNAFVRYSGGLGDVGMWQAANSLTLQYSGVVFAALAMDYLPRLAAVAHSDSRLNLVVNRQMEIVAWLAGPLGALLVLFAPLVVRLLLTSEFEPVVPLIRAMGVALTLKAVMYPMAYIVFAKDNRRVFFWLEGVFCNTLTVILAVAGYWLYGLIGLGLAQIADNVICLAVYYVLNRRLYRFGLRRRVMLSCLTAISATAAVYAISLLPSSPGAWIAMGAFTLVICGFAVRTLLSLWRR